MASQSLSPRMEFFVLALFYRLLFLTRSNAEVPAIYVFGDSLADVGNNNHLELSFLKADFPHNGVDYPGAQATGRYSNGKNYVDFLGILLPLFLHKKSTSVSNLKNLLTAEKLGVPSPPPYLSIPANSNTTRAFLQGVNFASGGAGVLDSTSAVSPSSFVAGTPYNTPLLVPSLPGRMHPVNQADRLLLGNVH